MQKQRRNDIANSIVLLCSLWIVFIVMTVILFLLPIEKQQLLPNASTLNGIIQWKQSLTHTAEVPVPLGWLVLRLIISASIIFLKSMRENIIIILLARISPKFEDYLFAFIPNIFISSIEYLIPLQYLVPTDAVDESSNLVVGASAENVTSNVYELSKNSVDNDDDLEKSLSLSIDSAHIRSNDHHDHEIDSVGSHCELEDNSDAAGGLTHEAEASEFCGELIDNSEIMEKPLIAVKENVIIMAGQGEIDIDNIDLSHSEDCKEHDGIVELIQSGVTSDTTPTNDVDQRSSIKKQLDGDSKLVSEEVGGIMEEHVASHYTCGHIPKETFLLWQHQEKESNDRKMKLLQNIEEKKAKMPPVRFTSRFV